MIDSLCCCGAQLKEAANMLATGCAKSDIDKKLKEIVH